VLALTEPERLDPRAAAAVAADLDQPQGDQASRVALGALAALLYGRPDLVTRSLVGALARATGGPLPPSLARPVADAWQLLATAPVAGTAGRALGDLLARPRLAPAAGQALLAALPAFARWRPDALRLDAAIRGAGARPDTAARDIFLREVVEPVLFASPRAFTGAMIDRIVDTFAGRARLHYTLGFVASGSGVSRGARARAERWLGGRPSTADARSALGDEPGVLVVHNVADGQGDEIVRVVPLLQSLLDARPRLEATVLTRRRYLYDHPRVRAALIRDDAAVDRALGATWDGIVDFNARTVPGVSIRPELESRVTDHVAARRPRLVIRAVTTTHHFVFETVQLGDAPAPVRVGADPVDDRNAYGASERLMMDLGLPVRAGGAGAGSLLVGSPSREAEAAWRRLRSRAHRPAALVNGFGGAHPFKGYTRDKAARLGAQITGLVDEGYAAIVLPNGEPWGDAEMVAAVLSHVGRRQRSHVRVAPDPAAAHDRVALVPDERPEVTGADRVMRRFKYFASYADLVVTVEGWLMHLAYAMGRPFRIFMAPASPDNWLPRRVRPGQGLVASMSPRSAPDVGDLLRDEDPPPHPSYARKLMLIAAARGLGHVGDSRSSGLLSRILASPDLTLRTAAVDALAVAERTPAVGAWLHGALADESAHVRAAAARALLASAAADARPLEPGVVDGLRAHVAIARHDWAGIEALGGAALPALAAATRDPDPIIRREARWTAARVIRRRLPAIPADTAPS